MDCDKYLELMSAALDGELTAEEHRELDSHLAVCPECAQLYQNLSGQTAALRELDCEVPADLKQRIMDNLPAQEKAEPKIKPVRWTPKTGRVIHWKRWAPVAAAACLALVVALVPKGGMSMNSAEAPQAYAPAADAPRTPGAAPGAQPMPSSTVDRYEHDSSSTAYGTVPSGDLEMGGLVDPAEPTAQEPQPDAGLEPEATAPAEPPMSAEPADSPTVEERCSFENPLAIRVSYGATPDPGAVIIGSTESLEKYLARFGSNAFDGEGNPVPNEKLETLKEVYNEEFFRTRRLLCVVVESGSGSNRYEIADVLRDSVLVSMYSPEIGTCDMATWLLTAEVVTMFEDGDILDVSVTR